MQGKQAILIAATLVVASLPGWGLQGAHSAPAAGVMDVSSGEELAATIALANDDPRIKAIKCSGFRACDFQGVLPPYRGAQALKVDGKGSIIDASGISDRHVFSATGGGPLRLTRLSLIGGLSGIYIELPADMTQDQEVELFRVRVREAAGHGVHINDPAGARGGVRLLAKSSSFARNGLGHGDRDGLHIAESGVGRIAARVLDSRFAGNGSDGLELVEKGPGDVWLWLSRSNVVRNGAGQSGATSHDDGLDIDEEGAGDVWVLANRSRFNGNRDDGLNLDERGDGSLYGLMERFDASANLGQGLSFHERSAGNSFVTLKESQLLDNGTGSRGQGLDILGLQGDTGIGILTLKDVLYGRSRLFGITETIRP